MTGPTRESRQVPAIRAVSVRDREHIVERTGDLWQEVRSQRVFMTGGTGFVGTWLVEAFVAANAAYDLRARLVLLTRDPERFQARAPHLANDRAIELLAGDAVDFAAPAGTFTFVVHAATEPYRDADTTHPVSTFDRDIMATRRVLEFARHAGTRRLLFTSSGAVYGRQPTGLGNVPEEYPGAPDSTDPRTAYGQGKRVSEFMCASYAKVYNFDAMIARLFAFVGPHLPLDHGYAVGNFLGDVLAGRSIRIGGDGTAVRSYLYAADLAVWLWTILIRGQCGRVYNVGSPEELSIRELAETIVSTIAPGTAVDVASQPLPGAAGARYVPRVSRAETELGLRAWTPLCDALQRTYDFHRPERQ